VLGLIAEGRTNREIGERFDRAEKWVRQLVAWRTSSAPETNVPIDWKRGSHATVKEIEAGAVKLLSEAPGEQVERLIDSLPDERKQLIRAHADHEYSKFRQHAEEEERNLTDTEREEREEAVATVSAPGGLVHTALKVFGAMRVVENLGAATEALREMQSDGVIDDEGVMKIAEALEEFVKEFDFARQLAG
jgi:hypothetical protein